ncbi:MAG: PfkB family carbohydrate kinase [Anaerolineaceae bacterium]|nr:PfkB family carbohydrate kinase [Anaerolineaceae bacterium]
MLETTRIPPFQPDVVCLGEIILDMFAAETGCRHEAVSAYYPAAGGAPANVAVSLSRQGCRAAFIGKVGDDAFGYRLRDALQEQGVDVRGLRFDREARTTLNFIALPDPNNAAFLFYRNPGADQRLEPGELDRDLIANARAYHCTSFALAIEPLRSAALEALHLAHQSERLVSFDVNYRAIVWPSPEVARREIFAILPEVDVLKVNQEEAELLTGETAIEKAATGLAAFGPSLCVVTLGPDGCYYQSAAGSGYVPGYSVKTIDASGCGDTFIGVMLAGLLDGAGWRDRLTRTNLERVLAYANAAAAMTATKKGVIPAIPTASDVAVFLKQEPRRSQRNPRLAV